LRFHCQTAAFSLTKPQPLNNVVRTSFQALAAVLGGAQSLHTNGLDEAYAIPSENAMKLALRTQQILAEETNVPNVADPLGGSYFVEQLTHQMEVAVRDILQKVESMGGAVAAIEKGYFQREIAETAYTTARQKASGEHVVVGLNKHVEDAGSQQIEIHRIDPGTEQRQITNLRQVRSSRDNGAVRQLLDKLDHEARDGSVNLLPTTIELVKARASMGEIVKCLRAVFGSYVEVPIF
jgi:methylmalonyl-CoA mutase N-terminal domain/subunit